MIQMHKIIHRNLNTCTSIRPPTIQFVGGIKIDKAQTLIKACHVRLVDAADCIFSGTDTLILNKIGKDFIAKFELQFVGDHLRQQQLIMAAGIAELRNTTLHQILFEEGAVEFWSYTFEGNA